MIILYISTVQYRAVYSVVVGVFLKIVEWRRKCEMLYRSHVMIGILYTCDALLVQKSRLMVL